MNGMLAARNAEPCQTELAVLASRVHAPSQREAGREFRLEMANQSDLWTEEHRARGTRQARVRRRCECGGPMQIAEATRATAAAFVETTAGRRYAAQDAQKPGVRRE